MPSGMPSHEEEKGTKMPKMVNLASSGLRRYTRLANKTRKKNSLFTKFSLAVTGACKVDKNPHVFLTRSNQHIQEIDRNFDGNLKHYGPMVFA